MKSENEAKLKEHAEKIRKILPPDYMVEWYTRDNEFSIVIKRKAEPYHFHVFLIDGVFYIEKPPQGQGYPSENKEYIVNEKDVAVYFSIIKQHLAKPLPEELLDRLRPLKRETTIKFRSS